MVRIPEFEEAPQGGVTQFQGTAPSAPAIRFDAIQQAFGSWQNQLMQEREVQAMDRQAELGEQAQSAAGPGEVAKPNDQLAYRYQRAFDQRAKEVYQQKIEVDAQRVAGELRREHWNNPAGFQQAWGAYQKGQRQSIREQDPVLADRVGRYLESYGQGNFENLAEQTAARERAIQKEEMDVVLKDLTAERQQDLLNSPDEENYWEYRRNFEQRIADYVDSGFFSADEGARRIDNNRIEMTREYVRGEFGSSLRAGDIGGAQGIIQSLRRGAWFEDNERDRALANQLERELQGMLEGMQGAEASSVAKELEQLRRFNNATQQGISTEGYDFVPHLEYIYEHGNPAQIQSAMSLVSAADLHSKVAPIVRGASISQLTGMANDLGQFFPQLQSEDMNSIRDLVTKEGERLSRAVSEGDWLGAAETFDWQRWAQDARASDNPGVVMAQTRAQLEQRRSQTLGRLEVGDTVDVGLFSNAELGDMAEQFAGAIRAGEYDTADDIVTLLGGVYEGDFMGLADAANRLSGVSGELAAATLLSAFGEVTDVTDLMALAGEGRVVDKASLRTLASATSVDVRENRDVARAVNALAMGNANVREGLFAMLDDVYFAQLGRSEDPGRSDRKGALDNIEKMMAPLNDTVAFDNGTRLPAAFLSQMPGGAAVVQGAVNEVVNDPVRFFGRDVPDQQMRFIQPVPMGDGSIAFRHTTENRLMTDPDGTPIRINAPEVIQQWDEERQGVSWWQKQTGDALSEGLGSVGNAAEQSRVWLKLAEAGPAAQHFGVDGAALEAVYFAAKQTPADQGADRLWEMMIRTDAQDEVDWSAVDGFWREQLGESPSISHPTRYRPEVDNAEQEVAVAANLLSQYQARYPQDPEAQFAAYWEGPEVVDALREDFGEDWLGQLPMGTQQFVSRAMHRMSKMGGNNGR